MTRPRQTLTTRNLVKVISILSTQPTWAKCMSVIGCAERTAFDWRQKCLKAKAENDTSSIFWLEYRGEMGWWTDFAGRARREHLIATEAKIREQAADGIEEPIFGPDQNQSGKRSSLTSDAPMTLSERPKA